MHPTPAFLPGESHGQRSLVGCSPWGHQESDTTERLHFHFLLSCIGEGNGNPLQCSCLENPKDGEAWWAAIYGVAQSRTRLKRLSSHSSSRWEQAQCIGKPKEVWFRLCCYDRRVAFLFSVLQCQSPFPSWWCSLRDCSRDEEQLMGGYRLFVQKT